LAILLTGIVGVAFLAGCPAGGPGDGFSLDDLQYQITAPEGYESLPIKMVPTNDGVYALFEDYDSETYLIAKYDSDAQEWKEWPIETGSVYDFAPMSPDNDEGKFQFYYFWSDDNSTDDYVKSGGFDIAGSFEKQSASYFIDITDLLFTYSGGSAPRIWYYSDPSTSNNGYLATVDISASSDWTIIENLFDNDSNVTYLLGCSDSASVWAGTEGGVHKVGPSGDSTFHDFAQFNDGSSDYVAKIVEDGDILWVNYGGKLLKYSGSSWELFYDGLSYLFSDGFTVSTQYIYLPGGKRIDKTSKEVSSYIGDEAPEATDEGYAEYMDFKSKISNAPEIETHPDDSENWLFYSTTNGLLKFHVQAEAD
jgi:hypothetical protein